MARSCSARRFFEQVIERNGAPEKVTIDKSGSKAKTINLTRIGGEVICSVSTQMLRRHRREGRRPNSVSNFRTGNIAVRSAHSYLFADES